jgi:hypothetical protein
MDTFLTYTPVFLYVHHDLVWSALFHFLEIFRISIPTVLHKVKVLYFFGAHVFPLLPSHHYSYHSLLCTCILFLHYWCIDIQLAMFFNAATSVILPWATKCRYSFTSPIIRCSCFYNCIEVSEISLALSEMCFGHWTSKVERASSLLHIKIYYPCQYTLGHKLIYNWLHNTHACWVFKSLYILHCHIHYKPDVVL